jgi:peptidoglycan/LPS O-acetylase OafA/YrhL
MVVLFHANLYLIRMDPPAPWSMASSLLNLGWMGVPLFFVISGYCISATADSERRNRRGAISYFKRRFRRIFPPYWAALAFTAVLVAAVESMRPGVFTDAKNPITNPIGLSAANWAGNLTLTQSWFGNFISGPRYVLGPAWSLCYEEQFYAITGLIVAVCPRWFFAGAILTTVLTFAARYWGFYVQGAFVDGYWFLFAAGIAVYWSVNYGGRMAKWVLAGALLAVSTYVFWSSPVSVAITERRFLLSSGVFAVLLLALRGYDREISGSRFAAPLLFCGRRCYSLYLVHWPITKGISHAAVMAGITAPWATLFFVIPACLAVSLAAATVFHAFIERRFLNSAEPGLTLQPRVRVDQSLRRA